MVEDLFHKFLKLCKNSKSPPVKIGENTYTWPSGCDGYKGGMNTGPVSERPPKPELSQAYLNKVDKGNTPRYFEGCGWYLPAQEGAVLKGGINEGPSTDRPDPPTMTHRKKPSSSSEGNSTTEGKIPLSPELVKTITEVIDENYESLWKNAYPSIQMENLYREFKTYKQRFMDEKCHLIRPKMGEFLNELDVELRQVLLSPVALSYKGYKTLKNLLNEFYKTTTMLYCYLEIDPLSLKPYSGKDWMETLYANMVTSWENQHK